MYLMVTCCFKWFAPHNDNNNKNKNNNNNNNNNNNDNDNIFLIHLSGLLPAIFWPGNQARSGSLVFNNNTDLLKYRINLDEKQISYER